MTNVIDTCLDCGAKMQRPADQPAADRCADCEDRMVGRPAARLDGCVCRVCGITGRETRIWTDHDLCDGCAELMNGRALHDVAEERARQQRAEGFTPEHDDAHDAGELALAAASYAHLAGHAATYVREGRGPVSPEDYRAAAPPTIWPWRDFWKPKDPRRDLVRAAALIVAEIERIDRASAGADDGEGA